MRSVVVITALAAALAACGDNLAGNQSPTVDAQQVTTAEDTPVTFAVVAADPEGQPLTLSATGAAHGTVTSTGTTVTYTPAPDYNGPDAITVTVNDGVLPASATVSITITPVNDRPVAVDDALAGTRNTPVVVDAAALVANDTDIDGDALTVTAVGGTSAGAVTLAGGTITFTPPAGFTGTATFAYTVSDGTANDDGVVTVTVGGANQAPVAVDDAITTAEDTAVTVNAATLVANDTDADLQTLSVTAVGNASAGTVALAAGVVTYTPAANATGTATFDYTVSDGADTDTGTVTVTITPVNDAPVATAGTAQTNEDTAVTITLAGTDAEGGALTFAIASGPATGTLGAITQLTPTTAQVTYTPNANATADDTFTFTVSDGAATSSAAAVVIDVVPVQDPPVATAGTATTSEDTAVTITLAGTDVDGDALTFAIASAPASGTLGAITQLTPTTAHVTYTPNPNVSGNDAFTFTVNDGTSTSPAATVAIAVAAVNDAPVATAGTATTSEDTAVAITLVGADLDGNPLTFAIASGPSTGTLGAITQLTPTTASVTYTPALNASGDATFTFTVSDGTATSAAATVTVHVTPVNDAPVANAGTATTDEDTAVTVTLVGADVDGDPLTFAIVTGPAHGTLGAIMPLTPTTALVVYTPSANSSVDDSFTFRVNDGTGNSAPATVAIDVVPVNDTPVASDDADSVEKNTPLVRAGSVYTANDVDVDGPALTVTAVGNPSNGTVALAAGTITFTPTTGFVGTGGFDYTVSDGAGGADVGRVTVTVTETNTPVVAVDDAATVAEDTALVIGAVFTANDIDPDPQTLTVVSAQNPVHGTIVVNTGVPSFVPDANYNGPASFEYVVSDGIATDVGLVSVTVTPVNDLPVALGDALTVDEDAAATVVAVLGNDSDVEGALTVTAVTQPAHGTVTLVTGVVRYQPAANYSGPDSFTYTVTDTGGATATATVTVTVAPVNDAPIAVAGAASATQTVATTITLVGSDIDLPAQTLTFAIGTAPAHGALGAITPVTATTATVVYTSTAGYLGADAFTFTVNDGTATSAPATVSITVTKLTVCNDGVIDAPETCDDQGNTSGDGCSATCQVENGWSCSGAPSLCNPICNDGILIAGLEACDDGNAIDTDGCTTQCKVGPVCAATVVSLAAGDHFAVDPATGTCYVAFDDEVTTFAGAQTACVASGGRLVTITSAAEQARVASVQNPAQDPWIGGTDIVTEGTFTWATAEPFSYTHFEPGQPDSGGGIVDEDCLALTSSAAPSGQASNWFDTACNDAGVVGRVCELAANPCGDGFVQTVRGEQCDDNNTAGLDGCSSTCQNETLFFSEYVEGSSNNKAVEIMNPLGAPVNLTGCSLKLYSNGATTSAFAFPLTQTIASHDVLVVCHASAGTSLAPNCDVLVPASGATAAVNFNGDDVIELFCNGATVDAIGQVGNRGSGGEWGTGLTSTADNTLRRKCSVTRGDTINNDVFAPADQWGGFAIDTFADLGTYTCVP
ncbi:MAG: tandem-95 repeat protein [Deltaproteobacteria bacterium]|nr:tandem-95 repeat protein [Deltaproteobacteria bacterium]